MAGVRVVGPRVGLAAALGLWAAIVPLALPAVGADCAPAASTVTDGTVTYELMSFTAVGACSWTVPVGVTTIDVLLVGGGGGGGGGSQTQDDIYGSGSGGGGGGGAVVVSTGQDVTAGGSVTVTVGTGGAGGSEGAAGSAGVSTSVSGAGASGTAGAGAGGGAGSRPGFLPNSGDYSGAGGASGSASAGGAQLWDGAGGGGGASKAGGDASNPNVTAGADGGGGGAGITTTFAGSSSAYGGGGGGGGYVNETCIPLFGCTYDGNGGSGADGGANGNKRLSTPAADAGANTGGGGGGGGVTNGSASVAGGAGGSGIVQIRYQAFLIPTLGAVGQTGTGFYAPITNYSAAFTWSATTTAGSASVGADGLVTVTGLGRGESATVTVQSSRAGYASKTASVTGAAIPPDPPPPPPPPPTATPSATPSPSSASPSRPEPTPSSATPTIPNPTRPSPTRTPSPSVTEATATPFATPTASPTASPTATSGEPTPTVTEQPVTPVVTPTPTALPLEASPTPEQTNAVGPITDSPIGPLSTVNVFTDTAPVGPVVDVQVDLSVGERAADRGISARASALQPGSTVEIIVRSEPRVVGTAVVDQTGSTSVSGAVPGDLEPGRHTIEVRGTAPDGQPVQSIGVFEIDDTGVVTAQAPPGQVAEPIDPDSPDLERALAAGKPLYDPMRFPAQTAGLAVAAVAGFTAIGAAARASRAMGGSSDSSSGERESTGTLAEVVSKDLSTHETEHPGWGDRSRTWAMPWTARTDAWLASAPIAVGRFFRLPGRALTDGTWSRAMFGSFGLLLWVTGLVVGFIAADSVGWWAFAPALPLLATIIALSILDAAVGIIAWLVLAIGVLITGHIKAIGDIRALMGLFVLYVALGLVASAIRPIRRRVGRSGKQLFDRVADYLVAGLIVFILAKTLYLAINGLSGLELVSLDGTIVVQIVAVLALWLRMGLEDLAMHGYPVRTAQVHPAAPPTPLLALAILSIVVRGVIFVLFASSFLGTQVIGLAILGLLFAGPNLLALTSSKFPNSSTLFLLLPRGIFRRLVLALFGIIIAAWILGQLNPGGDALAAYIIFFLPSAIIDFLMLFGRKGKDWPDGWAKRLVGIPLVIYTGGLLIGVFTLFK